MENIALVTIKFPRQPLPEASASEDCEVAASSSRPLNNPPTRCRPSKSTPGMSKPEGANIQPSIGVKFVSAGLAACYADLITFPLDTAKVRLQGSLYTGPLQDFGEGFGHLQAPWPPILGTDEEITDEDAWS